MEKRMKLQKNKYKLGIITSSLAFALTTSLAIGLPAPDLKDLKLKMFKLTMTCIK